MRAASPFDHAGDALDVAAAVLSQPHYYGHTAADCAAFTALGMNPAAWPPLAAPQPCTVADSTCPAGGLTLHLRGRCSAHWAPPAPAVQVAAELAARGPQRPPLVATVAGLAVIDSDGDPLYPVRLRRRLTES